MQRWEYIIITTNINEQTLNKIGEDGWEMCGATQEYQMYPTLYFKRPKQQEKRFATLNARPSHTEFITDAKREKEIKELTKNLDKNMETDEAKNTDYRK